MDSAEWAANLQCIIHRYIACNYAECASRCNEMLAMPKIHPTHAAFLQFYAGLSYELIAQAQQKFSPSELDNLRLANTHYRHAANILPMPPLPSRTAGFSDVSNHGSELDSTPRSSMRSTSIIISENVLALSTTDEEYSFTDKVISPDLWMRTATDFAEPIAMYTQSGEAEAPTGAMDRYSKHLRDLSQLLQSHIRWIAILLQESEAAQAKGRHEDAFAGPAEQEWKRGEERKTRIQQGRARGWARERFDVGRIDRLIKTALEEL